MSFLLPFDPSGPIYLGSWGGGVWASEDGGANWVSVMSDRGDVTVRDLEFGPDILNTLYASTEERGLLRAPFGQRIWTPVNAGLSYPSLPVVTAVGVHPGHPELISVGTSNGIFTSRDRGNSYPDSLHWLDGIPIADLKTSPLAPQAVFALISDALLFSPDRGRSGRTLATWPGADLVDLAMWPGRLDRMVAVGRRGEVLQYLEGSGFQSIAPPSVGPSPTIFHCVDLDSSQGLVLRAGSDQGLHESLDGGQSWTFRNGGWGGGRAEIWALQPAGDGRPRLYLGSFTRGLLVEDRPGGPWTEQNRGLRATWARALHLDSGLWLLGDAHGRVHRSDDRGRSWTEVTGDLETLQIVAVRVSRGGEWLASTPAGLWTSSDQGGHWVQRTLPAGHRGVHELLQPGWMSPREVWATTNLGVLRSLDGGKSWEEVPGLGRLGGAVFAAAASVDSALAFGADFGALWVGRPGRGFQAFLPPEAFGRRYRGLAFVGQKSTSLVVSSAWSGFGGRGVVYRVDAPLDSLPRTLDLTDLFPVLDPRGGDAVSGVDSGGGGATVVVCLPGAGIFSSRDAGLQWTRLDEGLPSQAFEVVRIEEGSPETLAVALAGRAVWSRALPVGVASLLQAFTAEAVEAGIRLQIRWSRPIPAQVWRARGDEVPRWWRDLDPTRESLDLLDPVDDGDRRVLHYELRDLDGSVLGRVRVVRPASSRPALRLVSNVPNPFNPRTRLHFVAAGGRIEIRVFDLKGRLVRHLFEGRVEAGPGSLVFDGVDDRGKDLASGTYLVHIRDEITEDVRSITLLR